ncbi:MAG: 5-carboxymethyl-2-hydroxymuconate isomerase [Pseudobacteriovorax sp.]|nr:5-carboxymethyl-2-hydroxymuconate isomerase [Pseudobacteriovorax sp.]
MPHFIVHTTSKLVEGLDKHFLLDELFDAALKSNLFVKEDIKVRIDDFSEHLVGGCRNQDFVHVFSYIMEGRTAEQKQELMTAIMKKLEIFIPSDIPVAMNIYEFETFAYRKR